MDRLGSVFGWEGSGCGVVCLQQQHGRVWCTGIVGQCVVIRATTVVWFGGDEHYDLEEACGDRVLVWPIAGLGVVLTNGVGRLVWEQ